MGGAGPGIDHQEITLRYRWRHVYVTPCETAAQVELALRSRGWADHARPCHPTCPLTARTGQRPG